ncbi:MAG TPA: alpha-ketoacid dehydrogenase subunit beta [Chloroflexota bacterium]|nr:alpha-ketoacid dehydrogenase subunit beta [Chloroflexota bacterium]
MPVMTYREALNTCLREEMRRDDKVFLLGEDIGKFDGAYAVTQGLLREFGPKRVRDTPIAEEAIAGCAIGAAMLGLRPVVEFMTINFILLAIDQIVNNAAKMRYMFGGEVKLPMVIRTPAGSGGQLSAQHSQSMEGWFANVPGMKVVAPSTPADARAMLKTAIRGDDPVLFLENLHLYNARGEVPTEEQLVPFGQARVAREGRDVTLVAHSRMTPLALQVAEKLASDGVQAEVVDLRSLRPLDRETLVRSVEKTTRAVVLEEDWPTFGVGAEIAATIQEHAFDWLDAPVLRVGLAEVPMPYSKVLEQAAIPDADRVIKAVRRTLERRR